MNTSDQADAIFVAQGHDRFGMERGLGITKLRTKLASADTHGRLLIIEQTMLARGGPPRHLHTDQDEWFYCLEGTFVMEVGDERFTLTPGDSAYAPKGIPHVWAYVGTGTGRILITFNPAGAMEAFFDVTTKAGAMPAQDPDLWRAHGMELAGPPLSVDPDH